MATLFGEDVETEAQLRELLVALERRRAKQGSSRALDRLIASLKGRQARSVLASSMAAAEASGDLPLDGPPWRTPATPQRDEQRYFSDEYLAPSSSNVYAFQFFHRTGDRYGILYVTYKANRITGRNSGRQIHGEHGKTVGRKVNKPGSTYAYFRVPTSVFTAMKSAYSKGTFVWDALRVRGTIWGTQYQYNLVVGQIVRTPSGGMAQYVPRKAGKKGFVTRSVADVGTGRRGYVTSTLPAPRSGTGYSSFGGRR